MVRKSSATFANVPLPLLLAIKVHRVIALVIPYIISPKPMNGVPAISSAIARVGLAVACVGQGKNELVKETIIKISI